MVHKFKLIRIFVGLFLVFFFYFWWYGVSWSVKQFCIVDSTMKVEYVVTSEVAKKAICLRKFLIGLAFIPCIAHDTIL